MTPTIRDVAREANVGLGTVSRVLNNSPQVSDTTRARVLAAAQALGFHPNVSARRLVTGQTHLIAFIERHPPEFVTSDSFWPQVLHGIHDAAVNAGIEVLFAPDYKTRGEGRAGHLLRSNQIDGAIISGPRNDDDEVLSLIAEGEPIVIQGSWPDPLVPSVDVDNHAAAYRATEHLIELGHTRIAIIIHAPLAYTSATQRYAGYQQALKDHGIQQDPDLVAQAQLTVSSGEQAMEAILKKNAKPTALFATSDTVAFGAMAVSHRRGLEIPRDLAVVGFDDIPLAQYSRPTLTTVRLPAYRIGWTAADLLIRMGSGNGDAERITTLETELIIRESCGALTH
ncbi:MAG: LacI family DNA-binding transcriptional regulator [Anaerolineales bacterium]